MLFFDEACGIILAVAVARAEALFLAGRAFGFVCWFVALAGLYAKHVTVARSVHTTYCLYGTF